MASRRHWLLRASEDHRCHRVIILVAGPQESRLPLAGSSMRRLKDCASLHSVRSSLSVLGNIQITQVLCVVMDQGTEKWLLTSRWMLWLAPTGLWGGLKLEAYHQSRQPQSFFLCEFWVFWDFGSLFRTLRRHFLRAVAAAVSSSTSLRRPRLRVAAQASRASHSKCSCSFKR